MPHGDEEVESNEEQLRSPKMVHTLTFVEELAVLFFFLGNSLCSTEGYEER